MTSSPEDHDVTPEGEQGTGPAPPAEASGADVPDGFGEAAGEMANETEVEGARGAGVDPGADAPPSTADDELVVTRMELAERTTDLQRLQAEFLNYKRRVDRDRDLLRENATYSALVPIIEVLDTIDRAREHAPLEGGFKTVADQLERVVSSVGLTKFGEPGDPFDPTVHEALSHIGEDPDVTVTTCKVVAKAGYRLGARVVRAAQVLVVDPPSAPSD